MKSSKPARIMETKIVEMVFPNQANHYGTLFGGHALRLMDQAAFISASSLLPFHSRDRMFGKSGLPHPSPSGTTGRVGGARNRGRKDLHEG
jgi:hypothetical protein